MKYVPDYHHLILGGVCLMMVTTSCHAELQSSQSTRLVEKAKAALVEVLSTRYQRIHVTPLSKPDRVDLDVTSFVAKSMSLTRLQNVCM
jgi:hypothetical protein